MFTKIPEIEACFQRLALPEIVFNYGDKHHSNKTDIKRIIHNDPATIVFWADGTKTVVKCMDGEKYDRYAGFCAALAKKVYGSTSQAKKIAKSKDGD